MEKPRNIPENPQSKNDIPAIKMPNNHPQKQETLANFSDILRKFSDGLKLFGGGMFAGILGENSDKKPNKIQEFFAKMLGVFQWVDIEKGITIQSENDVKKVREAFRPIIDLDETAIEFRAGDFIVYNKETGTVDFFPKDTTQKSGHSLSPTGIVSVAPSRKPLPKPEKIEQEIENLDKKSPNEQNNMRGTKISRALGEYAKQRHQANTGRNTCGTAVDVILTDFGIKNVTPWYNRHGNNWKNFLEKDSRFVKVEVTSLDEIPVGALLTFSGKWKINGKPNGTIMNQKYGHVEIKGSGGLYHSHVAANNPGGSARAPQFAKDFPKWVEATGFTGAYMPIAKTKNAIRKNQNT